MSTSSDARLHFEGVLDKAGKRFFEVRVYLHFKQNLIYSAKPKHV